MFSLLVQCVQHTQDLCGVFDIHLLELGHYFADVLAGRAGSGDGQADVADVLLGELQVTSLFHDGFDGAGDLGRINADIRGSGSLEDLAAQAFHFFFRLVGLDA